MTKLAFFDMDGTLCVPNYFIDNLETIGFSEEGWIAYCVEHGAESYSHCKSMPRVGEYARQLKEAGATLYVLTGAITSLEVDAKRAFVEAHYPGLFENVIGVAGEERKLPVLRAYAAKAGVALSECELIEDTYMTLLAAATEGIKATHVASFLTTP